MKVTAYKKAARQGYRVEGIETATRLYCWLEKSGTVVRILEERGNCATGWERGGRSATGK